MGKASEIKKACEINDNIFDYLQKNLRLGLTELQIKGLIYKKAKTFSQVVRTSFPAIVAIDSSGKSIHHKPGNRKLKSGSILLVDIGFKLKSGYVGDTTCMFYIGKPPRWVLKLNKIMDASMNACFKKMKPGNLKVDADSAARNVIIKNGLPDYSHGTGHSVEKKVHGREIGMFSLKKIKKRARKLKKKKLVQKYLQSRFKAGSVFTIEPGIYLKRRSTSFPKTCGFRKEICVEITRTGARKLVEIPKLRII